MPFWFYFICGAHRRAADYYLYVKGEGSAHGLHLHPRDIFYRNQFWENYSLFIFGFAQLESVGYLYTAIALGARGCVSGFLPRKANFSKVVFHLGAIFLIHRKY